MLLVLWPFVTNGQSFTVAQSFLYLEKTVFATLISLGNMISSLDTDALKVKALLEVSTILSAVALNWKTFQIIQWGE